jgi:hypothetical protein
MSMWTDWFIADAADAAAIASISTDEADFDDWPHLELSGVIESSLMALWGVLKGTPGKWASMNDTVLHQVGEAGQEGIGEEGLVLVTAVDTDFRLTLAAVPDGQLPGLAKQWFADASMAGWTLDGATETLREAITFARQAKAAGKPVLQLVVV